MPFFYHGGHLLKDLGSFAPVLSVGGIEWLLLDKFDTARAAGSVNGTLSEPSGHTRTVTDTGSTLSITGGQLDITAVAGARDPWLRYATGWARVAGRMLRYDQQILGYADYVRIGWANTLTATPTTALFGTGLNSASGLIVPPLSVVAYSADPTDQVTCQVILRSTGHFVLRNGVLVWIYRSDNTATMYPMVLLTSVDAALTLNVDNIGIADLPTDDPTLFPIPVLSDTFSDTSAPLVSDGLGHIEADGNGSGLTWVGDGTFSNSGNKAYVDPALGAEILTNGDFSAWTADDPDSWAIASESLPNREVTERDPGQLHADVMTVGGAANFWSDTANAPEATQNGILTATSFYAGYIVVSAYGSGSAQLIMGNANALYSSVGTHGFTARPGNTYVKTRCKTAGANDYTLDSATVKEIPFKTALRAVEDVASEPYMAADLTIDSIGQAGFVINLDSYTNPQNYIHIYLDRQAPNDLFAYEVIGGVISPDSLSAVTCVYSAGTRLQVRRIGNQVAVYYNNAKIGEWTTAASSANQLVALWATTNVSYFQNLVVFPTNGYDYGAYIP